MVLPTPSSPSASSPILHGEYKVPGGKLVVVDLTTSASQPDRAPAVITTATLSGDFFLEPDEALPAIAAGARRGCRRTRRSRPTSTAVEAASTGGHPDRLRRPGRGLRRAARPRALDRAGTTSPSSCSTRARSTRRCRWRSTRSSPGRSAPAPAPPTLRVWEWASNAVIIGSFQSLSNEVDLEAAARHDTEVVRRISGGGAMFVEPGNTITYSLYVPGDARRGPVLRGVLPVPRRLGRARAARDRGRGDLRAAQRHRLPAGKIGGAAQKRLASGAVLHHVTMSYDMDAAKMRRHPAHRAREAQRQGHRQRRQARRPAALPDRYAA